MSKLFISHSFHGDACVRDLRAALADHGHDAWIAPRELQGADLLWSELQRAIEEASAFAVVSSDRPSKGSFVPK